MVPDALAVLGTRAAEAHVQVNAFLGLGKRAHLRGQRVMGAITRTVHEPHLALLVRCGEGVQHAHHGRETDPGA